MPTFDETLIRDPDLKAKLEGHRGRMGFEFIGPQLIREQARRSELAALPRDDRRRAVIREVIERDPADPKNLRHIHSVLAICGLPYTRQALEVRSYDRNIGRMKLSVQAGKLLSPNGEWEEQPLPYGSRARLLLIHLCSEAILQKSATIDIQDSLTAFIHAMGFPVTGGKNGTLNSFKQQVNALAACTMRIGMWDGTRAKTINTPPFSGLEVWFPTDPDQKMLWPTTITFSHEFYSTLTQHALPVNTHAIRAFAGSPRKLDILFWLGYRLKSISHPLRITWDGLKEQWGQGYDRERRFRTDFADEIRQIMDVFPKLPATLDDSGFTLLPADPEVLAVPRRRLVKKA